MKIRLAPDSVCQKSWPDLVDPADISIMEQGRFRPLIWSEMDKRAAAKGHLFSVYRALHFRDTIHGNFRLWQGDWAGSPLILEDDWQWPCMARVFGWVRMSKRWGRWVRRFVDADIWLPKKHKKSPTGAAIGLYLFAFDGEAGSNIFSVAKDGKQAMRVHDHAVNMAMSSKCSDQFKLHRGTMTLTHKPTLSTYAPLHGDNVASQEGWSGSYVMDEVHVVPQRLADVLRGMGAARSEPLFVRLSTAGSDLQSYGRHRCEIGWSIERGEVVRLTTFFKFYGADQHIPDEDLDNPKIWKAANPSWGRTIDPEEFKKEFDECRPSPIDWTNFKQRRLNIWQTSSSPWISEHDWTQCARTINWDDLAGHPCSAGCDLSKTRDLTSLAITWEIEEVVYVWVHFWLPDARVHQLRNVLPFREWARLGLVTITKGRVLDENVIKTEIAEYCEKFGVSVFSYDPLFSANIVSHLQAKFLGMKVVPFKQTLFHFTPGTVRLDKLVSERKLAHDGNPILTWQVTHALLKTRDDYCKPIKPDGRDFRSVDGVQSAIMALSGLPDVVNMDTSGPGVLLVTRGEVTSFDVPAGAPRTRVLR